MRLYQLFVIVKILNNVILNGDRVYLKIEIKAKIINVLSSFNIFFNEHMTEIYDMIDNLRCM